MFYELLMAKARKQKQQDYIELEYLESTGTQFIDTGLQLQPLKAVINLCFVESNTRELMGFGSYRTTYFGKTTDGLFELGGSFVLQGSNTYEWQEITFTHNGLKVGGSGHLITKFGEITRTDNITDNVQGSSFCLFNVSNAGVTYACRCKISSAKFYNPDTNKLIMDLIPVLDKNLEPCMYDKVSGKYFYNEGDDEFKWKLPNQLEYLESTGTQYIDTGLIANQLIDKTFYIKMKNTGNSGNYAYNGAYDISGTGLTIQFGLYATSGTQCRTTQNYFDPSYSQTTGLDKSLFYELQMDKATYWLNGEVVGTHAQTDEEKIKTCVNPFLIFGRSQKNASNSITPMAISRFWIKNADGSYLQYLIPVYDKTLTPCMYDLVSKKYFYNNGTGQFKGFFEDGSQLLSYLKSAGTQYIETGLTVTPTIGFLGEAEASLTDASFETLAGYDTYFLPFAVVPSSKRICMGYGDNTNAPTLYPLMDGRLIPSTETSGVSSSLFIKYSGRFKVGLNFKGSKVWQFEDANTKYEVDLPEVLPQDSTHTITVFGRKYDDNITNRFMWRGPIYKAIFTDGEEVIMNLIPVLKSDNTACMYDLITKQYFVNKGTGSFTYGTQVNLFDPTKPSYVAGYISTNNNGNITSSTLTDTFYIPCKPNTTYLVKRTSYRESDQVWRVATIPTVPTVNMSIPHYVGGLINDLYLVIKSRDVDKYLIFSEGKTLHTDDLSKFTVLEIEDNNSLIGS